MASKPNNSSAICKNIALFSGAFITGYFTSTYMDMVRSEYNRLANECMKRLNGSCEEEDEKDEQEDEEESD